MRVMIISSNPKYKLQVKSSHHNNNSACTVKRIPASIFLVEPCHPFRPPTPAGCPDSDNAPGTPKR